MTPTPITSSHATSSAPASSAPASSAPASSRWSRLAAWCTPPVLAAVVLLHRNDPADAMELAGDTTVWVWIHVALLAALVLLAHTVRVLLVGLSGAAATVARTLLPVALVTYAAFDALVGLGTGILVERADTLGPDAAELVAHWWSVPGPIGLISAVAQFSWVVVLAATAVAHSRAGSSGRLVAVLTGLAVSFPLLHVRPVGLVPVALVVAALVLAPGRRPAPSPRSTG